MNEKNEAMYQEMRAAQRHAFLLAEEAGQEQQLFNRLLGTGDGEKERQAERLTQAYRLARQALQEANLLASDYYRAGQPRGQESGA